MSVRPIVLAIFTAALGQLAASARAETSASASYRLEAQALTSGGGVASSASFLVRDCIGPESEAPGRSSSASFILVAGCPAALPAGLPADDDDGDGVPNGVEDAAPNGGDANGDGIPDSVQGHVASIPGADGTDGYQTLQACADPACDEPCQLRDVYAIAESALPLQQPQLYFPFGLIGFTADCPSVEILVLYHRADTVPAGAVYEKFGPTPPTFGLSSYYELPGVTFGSEAVGSDPAVASARFSLVDGALGDGTPVDGLIVDPGGPALSPLRAAPALGSAGLAAALAALCALGGAALRRRRRA